MQKTISRGRTLHIIAETMAVACYDLDLCDPGQRGLLQSLLNAAYLTDRLNLAPGESACETPITPEDAQAVYDLLCLHPEARAGAEFLRDYWLTRLG
jgi:hypothetical protein